MLLACSFLITCYFRRSPKAQMDTYESTEVWKFWIVLDLCCHASCSCMAASTICGRFDIWEAVAFYIIALFFHFLICCDFNHSEFYVPNFNKTDPLLEDRPFDDLNLQFIESCALHACVRIWQGELHELYGTWRAAHLLRQKLNSMHALQNTQRYIIVTTCMHQYTILIFLSDWMATGLTVSNSFFTKWDNISL